jgi:hypothetical protein
MMNVFAFTDMISESRRRSFTALIAISFFVGLFYEPLSLWKVVQGRLRPRPRAGYRRLEWGCVRTS